MGIGTGVHDPSARYAGTSPRGAWGGKDYGLCSRTGSRVTVRRPRL